jgi:hypothetical protein
MADGLQTVELRLDSDSVAKHWVYDRESGLDFALILLPDQVAAQLRAAGHIAVTEQDWSSLHRIDMDRHLLVGLPECFVEQTLEVDVKGRTNLCSVDPVVVSVTARSPQADESSDWLCFDVGAADRLPSIVGMSGGPIIGFQFADEGARYWIVGIQSWWNRTQRIAYATRLDYCGYLIEQGVEKFARANQRGTLSPEFPGYRFDVSDGGILIPRSR